MLQEELEDDDDEEEEFEDDYSDVPPEEMKKFNTEFDENLKPLVPQPQNMTCL